MPTALTFVRAIALTALAGAMAFVLAYSGSPFGPGSVSAATITVTTNTDAALDGVDGQCGLREAIINANNDAAIHTDCLAGAGEDTIVFQAGITMITLIADLPAISDSDGLTIDGDGVVTISGANMYRPFVTNTDAGLTLQSLTVTSAAGSAIISNGPLEVIESQVMNSNGPNGGAIVNNDGGTATLTGSMFSGNSALTGSGGAIYNEGMMALVNTTVEGNNALTSGGGIVSFVGAQLTLTGSSVSANGTGGNGGGIYTSGTATLTNSTVAGNMAGAGQGGGIWSDGSLTLTSSTVNGNTAIFGAGIYSSGTLQIKEGSLVNGNIASGNAGGLVNGGTTTITASSVTFNIAAGYGGGINNSGSITITNSTIGGNSATTGGGGGFEHAHGTLTITNSLVSGNSTGGTGGAINSFDGATTIALTGSTVSGNTAGGSGGGIYSGIPGTTLTIVRSTLSGNTAATGGAIRSDEGEPTIANSTFSGNTAQYGGGIYNGNLNTTTLTNVTITNNTATSSGAGIYNPSDAPGNVILTNTIVATQQSGADCGGSPFVSQGNNLDSDNTCNLTESTDLPAGVANLGPLANNGGSTTTHALLPGSDAIDAADDLVCALAPIVNVDQRGVNRPQGAHCDIGAFELESAATPTATPATFPSSTPTATPSATVTTTPSATDASPSGTPQAETLVWGDDNCSSEADPVDSLLTLRHDAGLSTNTGDCPDMGEVVDVAFASPHPWGDVDCSGGVDPVDSLKLLRFDAGLPVVQEDGCPLLGADVLVS